MKKAIASLVLLALATGAMAADIAKNPAVYVEGVVTDYADQINNDRGDVAVIGILDGTFTDLTGVYAASVTAAGFDPDIFIDPMGEDYSGYTFILVSCSDNWWAAASYPFEIPAWAAYMDGGGRMILVGQDFLYGSGDLGFVQTYLGMTSASQDPNYGDEGQLDWTGTDVLAGLSDSMFPCFSANPWFTDEITGDTGVCEWSSPLAPGPQEGGCASVMGIFSTVEFGCGNVADAVVGAFVTYLLPTATEDASISTIKTLY